VSTEATRRALIEATAEVIRRVGVAGLTTKQVARAAGRSEGTIYNHFSDKLDLIEALLRTYVDDLRASVEQLEPGRGEVAEQLRTLMRDQIAARRQLLPVEAGLLADPDLRERHRDMLDDARTGPQRGHHKVTDYLRAEQQLGRFPADRDPQATAFAVIGACREGAYLELIIGPEHTPIAVDDLPARIVADLLREVP
jgi:AcrR family transcriptional regulator